MLWKRNFKIQKSNFTNRLNSLLLPLSLNRPIYFIIIYHCVINHQYLTKMKLFSTLQFQLQFHFHCQFKFNFFCTPFGEFRRFIQIHLGEGEAGECYRYLLIIVYYTLSFLPYNQCIQFQIKVCHT